MKSVLRVLTTRLAKLLDHQKAIALELEAVLQDIIQLGESEDSPGVPVPISLKSTDAIAAAAMVHDAQTIAQKVIALDRLAGPTSVFIRYLSPATIRKGRGFIKPCETFQQYEEDVSSADCERVISWPSGFYRDRETKETQFLLSIPSPIDEVKSLSVCVLGLPGNEGEVKMWVQLSDSTCSAFTFAHAEPGELNKLHDAIEEALKTITMMHDFT